jgi:hypothetical protein
MDQSSDKRASFVASKIMALDAKFCPHIYQKGALEKATERSNRHNQIPPYSTIT